MVQAVSTPDLLQYGKGLHWLPTAYDVDHWAEYGKAHKREPDGRIRIVHAPTNRTLKHTELFVSVVKELVLEGLPIDLILVEGQTWAECMAIKATADIVFDQLAFGYGCNAVEAWALGIPVISGGDPWTMDWMTREWGGLPFHFASETTLKDAVRSMVESPDLRRVVTARGLAHVRKYHDEKPALERLAELYHLAIKAYDKPARIPGKGVTFRNTRGRAVYDSDGTRISFTDGMVEVSDPDTVDLLRKFAEGRPSYGIEEVA
jgi:hypothetical protein